MRDRSELLIREIDEAEGMVREVRGRYSNTRSEDIGGIIK